MKIITCVFLLILSTALGQPSIADPGTDRDSLFQEANAAYSRNDFPAAIRIYEQLLHRDGYSPAILYNLGNSYAHTGNTGKAILNYERALRLSPGDSDILANLQMVRNNNGLFAKETAFFEQIPDLLSMNDWTMLGTTALMLLTCLVLLSLRIRMPKWTFTLLVPLCVIAVVVSIAASTSLHRDWYSSVVVGREVKLRISPFEGAASAGDIMEGRTVYPEKSHGEYIFVTDETGRRGWLQQSAVESVIK